MIKNQWSNIGWKIEKDKKLKETKILKLVTTKARKELKWKQELSLYQTINLVTSWYKNYFLIKKNKKDQITFDQIRFYKNWPDLINEKFKKEYLFQETKKI